MGIPQGGPGRGTVLLVLDATPDIGAGHAVRCQALAEEFRARGFAVAQVGRMEVPWVERSYRETGIDLLGNIHPEQAAAGAGVTAVVVDSYTLRERDSRALGAIGCPTLAVVDGSARGLAADLYLDQNFGADWIGHLPRSALLGPRFALIRDRVLRLRRWPWKRIDQPGPPSVAIALGGTDASVAAPLLLRLLTRTGLPFKADVVYSGETTALMLEELADPDQVVRFLAPSPDFIDTLASSDLVITAAGSTMLELAALGRPAAACVVVGNQLGGYRAAVAGGIVAGLGSLADVAANPERAAAHLRDLILDASHREELAGLGFHRVDGRGKARVADRLLQLQGTPADPAEGSPRLTVREASPADSAVLLEWRNDPVTRAASRTSDPVPLGEHSAWVSAVLADLTRLLLIGEVGDGVPVGTVRFDPWATSGAADFEISVTVAPSARGRGVARALIEAAEDHLAHTQGECVVVANTKPDNTASKRAFLACGYAATTTIDRPGLWFVKRVAPPARPPRQ